METFEVEVTGVAAAVSEMMQSVNLSEVRFMKSFKALFQKLTDLVCIILRLFPSG